MRGMSVNVDKDVVVRMTQADGLFPASGSLHSFGAWLDRHEQAHAIVVLRNESADAPVAALFLTEDRDGDFLLRVCEGAGEKTLEWKALSRFEADLGLWHATAVFQVWLRMREQLGYREVWSLRRDPRAQASPQAQRAMRAYAGCAS